MKSKLTFALCGFLAAQGMNGIVGSIYAVLRYQFSALSGLNCRILAVVLAAMAVAPLPVVYRVYRHKTGIADLAYPLIGYVLGWLLCIVGMLLAGRPC